MTTQANIPNKWVVPFAEGDSARVELPVTTADPTRASQTLGFPPLTMQPPESGGVPPQGEDFNGGMNQIARVCWWVLNGGGWPYDSTFATDANINGYPNGAKLQSADFRGDWISVADGNTNNPDTNGTNWVPGFQYGTTSLTGLTGGTVTPTPAQAAKGAITLAGALTSALTIVLPTWLKTWTITNNTTGAFVTIVKTAAGAGITVNQGATARVTGDGTNITLPAEQNYTGRLINVQVFTTAGTATYTPTAGTVKAKVRCVGGGGGGGGIQTTAAVPGAGGGGGGGGGAEGLFAITGTVTVTVGAGGQGGQLSNGWTGLNGGTSSFGAFCSASGGLGGVGAGSQTVAIVLSGASGGVGTNGYLQARGSGGQDATFAGLTAAAGTYGGNGGGGAFFGGGADGGATAGSAGTLCGEGGAGAAVQTTGAAAGGNGAAGIVVVEEYA